MKIIYIDGKDEGKENWRALVKVEYNKIVIKTENFTWGFRSQEQYDKVTTFTNHYDIHFCSQKENYVSIITKDKSKLEGYKQIVMDKLYEVIAHNIKSQKSVVRQEEKKLVFLESVNEFMFVDKRRDEKISAIIDTGTKI